MKKINLSILTTTLLASSLLANSITVEEALKNGKISGEVSLYLEQANNNGSTKDSGYSNGSLSLGYETVSFDGFKASLGFISNTELSEKAEDDYSDGSTPKSVMHTANINYTNDDFLLTLGRQAIDLEWIGDYHEAIVASTSLIQNTTIILGHTNKINTSSNDGALENFNDIGANKDGATVLDVNYKINNNLNINAYYMNVKNTFNAAGITLETSISNFNTVLKYATTDEDILGTEDGKILAIDLSYNIENFNINGGYITTDKNGGIGSISTLGDNINPLDSGNNVYSTDADTYYIGADIVLADINFAAMYGKTDYNNIGQSETEKEFNFSVEKEIIKDTTLSFTYADIDAYENDKNSDYFNIQLVYSF